MCHPMSFLYLRRCRIGCSGWIGGGGGNYKGGNHRGDNQGEGGCIPETISNWLQWVELPVPSPQWQGRGTNL